MKVCVCSKARVLAGVCMLCWGVAAGAPGGPPPLVHVVHVAPLVVMAAAPEGHDDQPHTPELAEPAALPGPAVEVRERPVLVADDPVHGQLDGTHILGYCDTCPAAAFLAW